jgi:hemoglobin
MDKTSLYSRLGGAVAIATIVDAFYADVLADAALVPYFEGKDPEEIKRHQRQFIAVASGGPNEYVGRKMGEAHAHLNITGPHFDLVAGYLSQAMLDLAVPLAEHDELILAVAGLKDQIVTA